MFSIVVLMLTSPFRRIEMLRLQMGQEAYLQSHREVDLEDVRLLEPSIPPSINSVTSPSPRRTCLSLGSAQAIMGSTFP